MENKGHFMSVWAKKGVVPPLLVPCGVRLRSEPLSSSYKSPLSISIYEALDGGV